MQTFVRTDEEYRSTYELIRLGKMPESNSLIARLLNVLIRPRKGGIFATSGSTGRNFRNTRSSAVTWVRRPEWSLPRRTAGSNSDSPYRNSEHSLSGRASKYVRGLPRIIAERTLGNERRADGGLLVYVHSVDENGEPLPDAVFTFVPGDPQYGRWIEEFKRHVDHDTPADQL